MASGLGEQVDSSMKLMGLREITELTGKPRRTVDTWRHRGQLPEPDWIVSGRPIWREKTIHDWWANHA